MLVNIPFVAIRQHLKALGIKANISRTIVEPAPGIHYVFLANRHLAALAFHHKNSLGLYIFNIHITVSFLSIGWTRKYQAA